MTNTEKLFFLFTEHTLTLSTLREQINDHNQLRETAKEGYRRP